MSFVLFESDHSLFIESYFSRIRPKSEIKFISFDIGYISWSGRKNRNIFIQSTDLGRKCYHQNINSLLQVEQWLCWDSVLWNSAG